MYSREKFKEAIELYFKYDKSVASVIREFGYPDVAKVAQKISDGARNWYRSAYQTLETFNGTEEGCREILF